MSPAGSGSRWSGGVPTLAKLVLITGAGVAGIAVLTALTFVTTERIKVGGPLYRDALAGRDLTSDILPPPIFTIEAYLLASQLRHEPSVERQGEILTRVAGLRAQFDERARYWITTLEADDARRRLLVYEVVPTALALFRTIDRDVVPAQRRGDAEALGLAIDGPLTDDYRRHRAAIDRLVGVTSVESAAIERAVLTDAEAALFVLALVAVIVALTVAAIGIVSARGVKRVEDVLRLRSAALRAAGNAVMITNREGVIEWVNPAWCALTGYTAAEARGRTPRILKSGVQDEPFYRSLWTTILGGHVWESELVNRRKDGTHYYEQETITPVADASGGVTHFIAIKQDITARRLADEALQRKNRLLAAVSDGLTAFLERRDWGASMGALLREALRQTGSEYGFVGVMAEDGTLRALAHEGVVWDATINREMFEGALRSYAEKGYVAFTGFDNLFGHALKTGEVVIANDPATDPRSGGLPAGHPPLRCFLGVPIVQGGAVIGLIGVANSPGGYSAADEETIGLLVRQLGALCERYRQTEREARLEAERREVEARLQRSEERFRSLFESSRDAVLLLEGGAFVDCNQAALDLFRCPSRDRFLATGPSDLSPAAQPDGSASPRAAQARIDAAMAHGAQFFEWVHRRLDGAVFPAEVLLSRFELRGRTVIEAVIRDITERKRIEEAMRANERRFRSLIENAQDLITVIDEGGLVRFASPSVERILGLPPNQVTGRHLSEFAHSDDLTKIEAGLSRARVGQGPAVPVDFRFRHADGSWRTLESIGRRLPDEGPPLVVVNSRDLTDRRRLEEQFRQAQKMEAIGQLAGGVAHDFNNILLAVMMQVEMSLVAPGVPDEVRRHLGEIGVAADRAAGLTRQLLAFGRRQVMQSRTIDLNEAVSGLSRMLSRILGEDVQLQIDLHPHPLITRVDAGMLDQLLMNLVVNARDAMPSGGRLVIATAPRSLTPAEAPLFPDASPRRYVSLRVTDTGTGIAPEDVPHIFEPFFTTKGVGKGTGLGLATVFGIVKQHRGSVKALSEVGRGTSFEVLLPASEGTPEAVVIKAAGAMPRGTETILVVEDEPAVRMLTVAILESGGYRVLEAATGADALGVWDDRAGAIDLLFTDLVMPGGMRGWDLAEQLRARRPSLKVIFTSGYSADLAGHELTIEEGRNFLQKPYAMRQLLDAVRRCLDG